MIQKNIIYIIILISIISCNKNKLIEEYYSDGKIKAKYYVINNKKNGKYIEYFPSGKISRVTFYKNDCPNGKSIRFYENGNILKKGQFIKGKAYGVFYFQNIIGGLDSINEYILLYEDSSYFNPSQYVYDEKDPDNKVVCLNRQVIFDSNNQPIKEKSLYFSFVFKNDTISLGDTLKVKFEFNYTSNGKKNVYSIWEKEKGFYVHITPKDNTYVLYYDYIPRQKGLSYYQGVVEEIVGNKKRFLLFKEKYFVK